MIHLQFEFSQNLDYESLISKILSLKEEIKPIYFCSSEMLRSKSDRIDNAKLFDKFIKKNTSGFFMKGNGFYYYIINNKNGIVEKLDIGFDFMNQDIEYLVRCICELNPDFGFACLKEERFARNRHFYQIGANKIESWVGRDIKKQIPGFYWITLISDQLLQKYSIPPDVIISVAKEFSKFKNGLNLFKFYENPEDWKNTSEVADLCASLPGVFDISVVTPAVSNAKNVMHFLELISQFD